jgi:hypothetical protein
VRAVPIRGARMHSVPSIRSLPLPRLAALATLVAVTTLAVAACGPSGSSATPSLGSPQTSLLPATTSGPSPSAALPAGSAATGQTDTDWGRIWDSLPASFPKIPGSTPAEEGAIGPASATLVVQGVAAKDVVTTLGNGLKGAGYATDALSGPLEDGTYTLDMHGPQAGCQVQVTASPTGGLTTVRILYGAACPKA